MCECVQFCDCGVSEECDASKENCRGVVCFVGIYMCEVHRQQAKFIVFDWHACIVKKTYCKYGLLTWIGNRCRIALSSRHNKVESTGWWITSAQDEAVLHAQISLLQKGEDPARSI